MRTLEDACPRRRGLAARRSHQALDFAAPAPAAPVPQGAAQPAGLDEEQRGLLAREGRFLQQLLDNSAVDDYPLPVQCAGAAGGAAARARLAHSAGGCAATC